MTKTMTDMYIDLPETTVRTATGRLQERLADAVVLQTHARQAHWNVRGPAFIALHELFDRVAALAVAQADALAERIGALAGRAQGTAQAAVRATTLPAWPDDAVSGDDHLRALARALAVHANALRRDARTLDEAGDMVSSDLLVGLAGEADGMLWMLRAHLEAAS